MAEARERARLAEEKASSLSHEVQTWQGASKMQEELTTMISQRLQKAQSNEAVAKTSLDQALTDHGEALTKVKKEEKEKEDLRGTMWLLQERLKEAAQEPPFISIRVIVEKGQRQTRSPMPISWYDTLQCQNCDMTCSQKA